MTGRSQAVRLPKEFRFDVAELAIWRERDTVMLRSIKHAAWPKGFLGADPNFRPRIQAAPTGRCTGPTFPRRGVGDTCEFGRVPGLHLEEWRE